MTNGRLAAAMREAMVQLHWTLRDLFIATFAYGNVGTELDVEIHLETGTQLTDAQTGVLIATLNDALLTADNSFRVVATT